MNENLETLIIWHCRKKNKKILSDMLIMSFKETILYNGGSFTVQRKAHVCIAEAHGVRVLPPSSFKPLKVRYN